jgi:hypothetical protein
VSQRRVMIGVVLLTLLVLAFIGLQPRLYP